MFKSTIQVTLFSISGIFINFIIQLLLAYFATLSEERDAYFAALTLPAYISVFFTGSIGMLFIPYLIKYFTIRKKAISLRFIEMTKRIGVIFSVSAFVLLPVLLLNQYWLANAGIVIKCVITTVLVTGLFWLLPVKAIEDKYHVSVMQLIRNKI